MLTFILSTIIAILVFILLYLGQLLKQYKYLTQELSYKHQSQAVKHGQTVEQFIPFAKNFPYNTNNFKFLGQPIDGIAFNEENIVFLEFKTGKSQLNKTQQKIKQQIENNQVTWEVLRY